MFKAIVIAGITLAVLIFIGGPVTLVTAWNHDVHTQTCKVVSKDRTSDGDGNSDVRLYTDRCGVLTVEDSIIQHRFNSADVYAQIKSGQTYKFTTVGWRNGFFSTFPNVVLVDGKYGN